MKRIRTLIREVIGLVSRISGIAWIIRSMFCRNKATILVYHKPSVETFKAHMEYLSKRYRFISMGTLLRAIENGKSSDIPSKAVIVNLDDGHKSNYELLPIIKELNIRPVVHLCSDIVGTNRHFWWSDMPNSIARNIKKLPIEHALEKLRRETGYETTREYEKRQALCESEILEMEPHVDFGSHSQFHTVLTQCGDGECMDEIRNSKRTLDAHLSKPVVHFAYPNGDYGEREIEYLRACGYKSARTLDVGWNGVDADPYKLKAIGIEDDASINVLCGQLTGLFAYFKYLCHGSFRGMRPPLF